MYIYVYIYSLSNNNASIYTGFVKIKQEFGTKAIARIQKAWQSNKNHIMQLQHTFRTCLRNGGMVLGANRNSLLTTAAIP